MEAQSVLDQPRGRSARRFLRHLLEMIVVMMLGMCVLGAAWGAFHQIVFGSAFADAWRDYVGLAAFAMAFNMTVPMVFWMRYRGHSWERGGEMAIAMNLPLLPLLLLYALDLIPAQAVLGLQMMLMIPAMVLAMLYRKEEYSARAPEGVAPASQVDRRSALAAPRRNGSGVESFALPPLVLVQRHGAASVVPVSCIRKASSTGYAFSGVARSVVITSCGSRVSRNPITPSA